VVSMINPYGRILGFLDRSRYFGNYGKKNENHIYEGNKSKLNAVCAHCCSGLKVLVFLCFYKNIKIKYCTQNCRLRFCFVWDVNCGLRLERRDID
jgi:hypothetical protein